MLIEKEIEGLIELHEERSNTYTVKALRQLLAAMEVVKRFREFSNALNPKRFKSVTDALQCYDDLCTPTSSTGTDSTAKDSDATSSPEVK